MRAQDLAHLLGTGLVGDVERIVVDAHRDVARRRHESWRPPDAYRWLRYEHADPIARLAEGVEKLRRRSAKFDAEAVDKACVKASKTGFLN